MGKNMLNEIARMRKMMGLNENYDNYFDTSSEDNWQKGGGPDEEEADLLAASIMKKGTPISGYEDQTYLSDTLVGEDGEEFSTYHIYDTYEEAVAAAGTNIYKLEDKYAVTFPDRSDKPEMYENDDYVDDVSAAKSSAKGKQNFNQDAIDYVGGEDMWNTLSQDEKESVLANIGRDWDRSRSMGEAEEDSMRITIPIMSALSDIQERAPELRERINFIKALVQKMESNSVITDSELNDLEKKFNTHSY